MGFLPACSLAVKQSHKTGHTGSSSDPCCPPQLGGSSYNPKPFLAPCHFAETKTILLDFQLPSSLPHNVYLHLSFPVILKMWAPFCPWPALHSYPISFPVLQDCIQDSILFYRLKSKTEFKNQQQKQLSIFGFFLTLASGLSFFLSLVSY